MLYHIFELAYTSLFNEEFLEEGDRGAVMLVHNLSQVSKQWREIVLLDPQLWAIIDIPNRLFVQTCVTRSRNVPLRIHLNSGDTDITPQRKKAVGECIPILATCIDRWQSLSHDNVCMETLHLLFAHPAPKVETLRLEGVGNWEMFDIPDGFFNGKLPRLRQLRLVACRLPLNPSNYNGLTELSLFSIEFIDSSMCDLLGVLVACPALEIFRFHQVYIHDTQLSDHALLNICPVDMPQLRELSIAHSEDPVLPKIILGSIRPPPSVHLRIVDTIETYDDLRSILPLHTELKSTLQSLLDIEELAFTFGVKPPRSKSIDACDIRAVSRRKSPDRLPYPVMTLFLFPIEPDQGLPEGFELSGRLFQNIGRELPLPRLKTLKIIRLDSEILSAASFAGVLDNLSSVELLELVSRSTIFVRAPAFTSDQRLCPSLETLRLEHSSITGEDLLTIVESRAPVTDGAPSQAGTSSLRLVLADCSAISQSYVEELGAYAEVIVKF
ncbi:hypothetical protein BOTBODRAFT_479178 [Botryobasidium botryosum FD-172 SS1]|uniref:F-box domain-containing protein n=1 Tax=Botryobasidium botryosum (strain FD-172 SS1) TaxID=930990 RepID=A0A067N483_BOTB1|nr:hypothetical protein BOTBODRAFT_479178 [Botryobasidium botryosum FD-172 SS1]